MHYLLIVYVTDSHTDSVKTALFNAGAGCYQHYDQCCWQTTGIGQFRPLDGSHPSMGEVNQIETVTETKLEMLCTQEHIQAVIDALKESHPYEEPAYHVLSVNTQF